MQTTKTLSACAWDAMRTMGEFVASRGDSVGEKLTAWTQAKETFDAKVREVDAMAIAAKVAAAEVQAALECLQTGQLSAAIEALQTARQKLAEPLPSAEMEKSDRDALMDQLRFPSIRRQA